MPDVREIPVITEVSVNVNSVINIKCIYNEEQLPNTISTLIASANGLQDSVSYSQGDLVIRMKNYPSTIFWTINSLGELILFTTTGDVSNYSINGNGELIWS